VIQSNGYQQQHAGVIGQQAEHEQIDELLDKAALAGEQANEQQARQQGQLEHREDPKEKYHPG